ncbi:MULTISPECIES: hypothetical protein [Burkholderia]|uniref:hypothetical protein n=1 Tax=Burkholderia TaxID=32008 RepID=UPI001178640F|nr:MULTISPECIES: hypothetical protein [Burkholderia]MBY4725704.1 hypothetical protein [Burkholderia contaminans]MCI3969242.1 hypothetical protein [Burkholderia sp. HI4860]
MEIALSSGDATEGPLLRSLEASKEAWVAVDENNIPFCIYGVAEVDGFGSPWMVATPEVYRFSKRLVKDGRKWIAEIQEPVRIFVGEAVEQQVIHAPA